MVEISQTVFGLCSLHIFLKDCYPVVSTSKSSSGGSGRQRHFYDDAQLELLEAEFARDPFPNREGRRRIAQLIGVSEKSIMWWFQNRRRRARQLESSRAVTTTRETNRQQRRSSPYVSRQRQQDTYDSAQVLLTPGFYSHPPAVPATVEPINYSSSGSSSSSPLQSEWLATSCPQHVVSPQSNYNNSDGTHQQPQQQDYSSYYWNNWEYSPPFYPTSLTNSTFYSNTVPDLYSSSYSYYSPETTNPYYYQSCM